MDDLSSGKELNASPDSNAVVDSGYQLSHRYVLSQKRVYLTGTQALVRLMLEQAASDRASGMNTAGLVSGYRGSPLGAVDQEFWKAAKPCEAANIRFQPAINEDLAATILMGSQQVESDPESIVDGVFGLWYGKGPGVDRAGDALKHGTAFGSSPRGGVLVVVGDDHGCVSSSMSHQSDPVLAAWSIPVLHPADLQDVVPFGLFGFAISRYSGAWVGFKAISETIESLGTIEVPQLRSFSEPVDFLPPKDGLHYRWPDLPGPQFEKRNLAKMEAVKAFARANPIDRMVIEPNAPEILIVSVGKAHGDTMEAFRQLGLSEADLKARSVALLKIGLVFPLEPSRILELAGKVSTILVIEEKAAFVETQIKELLFNRPVDLRPLVVGKTDENGLALLPAGIELRPSLVAPVLSRYLNIVRNTGNLSPDTAVAKPLVLRTPYYCSGCPHNSSTKVPEGSRAFAGIGCHFMASWMDRSTESVTQMGGEGVQWVGRAPFLKSQHVFQNLGDGTYFHSGHLAIRQAIAAKSNITYKILFNDAVAMTGGQPIDGTLNVPQLSRLMRDEGVERIAIVTEDVSRYAGSSGLAAGVTIEDRIDLDRVQRELRQVPGVSVLIYDQGCAAEKRRKRKRKELPDPDLRIVINERVCEGCGDCQTKSNCMSVVPLDTEFGTKRRIDQTSCNKDVSCVQGFCPSFVTVSGGKLRRSQGAELDAGLIFSQAAKLLLPALPKLSEPFELLVAGVGGTGIVTLGALVVMAAKLEGRQATALDFMGFAQKGGPVVSHIRVAETRQKLHQVRIDKGQAHALIACDLVVAGMPNALGTMSRGRTKIVANTHETQNGAMLRDASARIDTAGLERLLKGRVGEAGYASFDAQALAQNLMGDTVTANILLLGYAFQMGLVPVSLNAMERAMELNATAIDANKRAFAWGRLACADPEFVERTLKNMSVPIEPVSQSLTEVIDHRIAFLTAYQNKAYAERYRLIMNNVLDFERRNSFEGLEQAGVAEAVARNLFKLMAYKDEYEVARLYSDGAFAARIARDFEDGAKLKFHLAPPVFSRIREGETEPRKITFGSWMMKAFGVLAKFKFLRGTPFDPFGRTVERRQERALVCEYEALVRNLLVQDAPGLASKDKIVFLLELLRLPESIRGYGPVKERSVQVAQIRKAELLALLTAPLTNANAASKIAA